MLQLSELKKKDVISSDGKILGSVLGVTILGKWNVGELTVKIEKDATETLGLKKPLLFALRMDLKVEHIKAISDRVVLNKPLKDIGKFLKEHNEELSAGRMEHMEIVDTDGKLIGEVDDIVLNCKTECTQWEIPSLLVDVNKEVVEEIGLEKSLLKGPAIHISMKHVTDVGDVVMLGLDAENVGDILKSAPIKKK
jgi:sporulation protein YlmC with PRC-barrel domain